MRLFIFGFGYSCRFFVRTHASTFSQIAATVRTTEGRDELADLAAELLCFDGVHADPTIDERIAHADLILVSVPPAGPGDPVLAHFRTAIAASKARVIYLSTVGVYADHAGGWIDETASVLTDDSRRGLRARAEAAWRTACADRLRILRLAGIYGPGRNALRNLQLGRAHRIVKPGQVFNRIHVDDIVQAIAAAAVHPQAGIWNVCDDEPAPPQDVVTYAATLMNVAPPPVQDFDSADLSPMARSFYASSNRIANTRLRQELGVDLAFPNYRSGLNALWTAGDGHPPP
jgi:hypothetical protein